MPYAVSVVILIHTIITFRLMNYYNHSEIKNNQLIPKSHETLFLAQ